MDGHPVGSISCPRCGTETRVGLPRSATIEAVTAAPSPPLDEAHGTETSRKKRRKVRCPNGHLCYVYFAF